MKAESTNILIEQTALKIVEIARSRTLQEGEHLTEESFAAELGLSRSPVRRAFSLLDEYKIVTREPNRGYFLSLDARKIDVTRLPSSSDPMEELYLKLADDLLSRKIPEEFFEASLIREYGISRGQLLKMLGRMASEGLIVRRTAQGWKVNPFLNDADAHSQSYRFRMAIEPAALLEPTYRIDKPAFQRARKIQTQMINGGALKLSRSKLFQVGAEFHEMLVRCSGNRHFLDAIQRQNQLRRLLEYRSKRDRVLFADQCREHLKLLDLIEAQKQEAAANFLRQHLSKVSRKKTTDRPGVTESRAAVSVP
jgi:DNA-binding GntR family transcriptional regulator